MPWIDMIMPGHSEQRREDWSSSGQTTLFMLSLESKQNGGGHAETQEKKNHTQNICSNIGVLKLLLTRKKKSITTCGNRC